MQKLKKLSVITLSGLSILPLLSLSCSQQSANDKGSDTGASFESQPEFRAPNLVTESFSIKTSRDSEHQPDDTTRRKKRRKIYRKKPTDHQVPYEILAKDKDYDSDYLGIKINSLDKEFLLRVNVIQGGTSPSFNGLKTRIVAFVRKGGNLYLMEADKGHAFYSDLPQKLILAEFSIKEETDDSVFIDFNQGMSSLYTQDEFFFQDYYGNDHPDVEEQFDSNSIHTGYLESMTFNDKQDRLSIRQIAQLSQSGSHIPVEIRYELQPYRPSKSFKPTVSSSKRNKVAFFEANPVISERTQKTIVHAAKFNIHKPIIFALSANTPKDYKQAIKDGVLYWNKALGKNIVQVIDAPKGVTAPSYDYNMIQWIDWKDASFAYADAQLDPRTGEVLNAQIYLSSVFAVHGKEEARKLVRGMLPVQLNSSKPANYKDALKGLMTELDDHQAVSPQWNESLLRSVTPDQKIKTLSLKGFQKEPLCRNASMAEFSRSMAQLVMQDVPETAFLKVSQDHVRETVAHEVGHTLGLRHNFAGIKGGSYTLDERDAKFEAYLTQNQTPEQTVITSSVMDYIPLQESAMAGDLIHRDQKAFSYDQYAMSVLYHHMDQDEPEVTPLFCTDSHVRKYIDCNPFELNSSPLAYAKWQTSKNIQNFPKMLAEYFISYGKSVEEGDEKLPLDQILYPSYYWSLKLLAPRSQVMKAVHKNTRSLAIDRSFGWLTESNIEQADQQYAMWIQNELNQQAQGKWQDILDHLPENFSQLVISEFDRLIESDAYRSGTGPGGDYRFTDADILKMKKAVRAYMKEMEKSLGIADVLQLYGLNNISNAVINEKNQELDEALSVYLANKAASVIFALKKSEEDPQKPSLSSTLLRVTAKAKISETNPELFYKKMLIIKMIMEKGNGFDYLHNDGDPGKSYSPEELSEIASLKLNEELEGILSQINLGNAGEATTSTDHQDHLMDLEDDSETGTDPQPVSEELPDSSELIPAVESSDNPSQPMEIEIPVGVHLPVILPEFRYEYPVRILAAKLLDNKRGESLAFGMRDRSNLADEFTDFYTSFLRQEKVSRASLSKQTRALSVYVQENEKVMNSFSDSNILSMLLGML